MAAYVSCESVVCVHDVDQWLHARDLCYPSVVAGYRGGVRPGTPACEEVWVRAGVVAVKRTWRFYGVREWLRVESM